MLRSDYATVQGTIILVAAIMVTLNLIVDLTYAYLDPQIGYESDVA
jgi:peptide/nickel transport system permease protein